MARPMLNFNADMLFYRSISILILMLWHFNQFLDFEHCEIYRNSCCGIDGCCALMLSVSPAHMQQSNKHNRLKVIFFGVNSFAAFFSFHFEINGGQKCSHFHNLSHRR